VINYIYFTVHNNDSRYQFIRNKRLQSIDCVPGVIYRAKADDLVAGLVNVLSNVEYLKRVVIGKEKVKKLPSLPREEIDPHL
jgi:hypothetical protein